MTQLHNRNRGGLFRLMAPYSGKLKVDGSNQIQYGFFEMPKSSNLTAQRRTAMGKSKIQG